ncbi:MAG TPA: putative Ig domain-containing protein, partial [Planctomycetaceae bacterium]|nr:putative Ig domain-containing protein [Planctomycetaceae bacterium]
SAKPATFTATPAVSIERFPNITSPNKATFTVGTAGSFTLTATGFPTPTLSLGGALPAGLTFDPSTGVISGTPSAGTVGGYSLMVAASNTLGVQVVPFTLTVQAAQASKLVFLSSPASGTAGQALSPSLTVAVEDAFGDVVTDDSSTVSIAVSTGPARLSAGSITSAVAVNGVATLSSLFLDAAGAYTLGAAAGSLTGATSDSITIGAGAASKLFVSDAPVVATAGQTLSPGVTVVVEDAFGNTVTTDTSKITLSVSSGPAGFASGSTTSEPAVNGVATFNNLILDAAGVYTLNAADGSLASGTSTSITVNPATASKLFVSDAPVLATAGQALSPGVTIVVQDAFGNVVTSNTSKITLEVKSGPALFASGSTTSAVAVKGVATFGHLILDAAGPYTLIALSGSLASGTSSSITVNAATASKLFVSDAPVLGTAGQVLSPGVTVVVEDAFGNTVTTDTAKITLSVSSGPASFASGSTTSEPAVNGVATFNNLILDAPGNYILNASDGSLGPALSTTITVNT